MKKLTTCILFLFALNATAQKKEGKPTPHDQKVIALKKQKKEGTVKTSQPQPEVDLNTEATPSKKGLLRKKG